METKEQKPWYHGVKWSWEREELHLIEGGDYVIRDGATEVVQIEPMSQIDGEDWFADVCYIPSHSKEWANLIASAPETATQRDSLLSVQKQLVEALEEIVAYHIPDQPMTDGGDELSWAYRQHGKLRQIARAAILAAKASL